MDPFRDAVILSDTKQKEDKYNEIFDDIIAKGDVQRAKDYIQHRTIHFVGALTDQVPDSAIWSCPSGH